jgi:hypothetical protein
LKVLLIIVFVLGREQVLFTVLQLRPRLLLM